MGWSNTTNHTDLKSKMDKTKTKDVHFDEDPENIVILYFLYISK